MHLFHKPYHFLEENKGDRLPFKRLVLFISRVLHSIHFLLLQVCSLMELFDFLKRCSRLVLNCGPTLVTQLSPKPS